MVDINLHQASENELRVVNQKNLFRSGSFIVSTFLVIILGSYGLTIYYKNSLLNKEQDLIAERDNALKSFDAKSVNDAVDFQYRIENINFNLDNKKNPENILKAVEEYLVRGASLESLSFNSEDNKISMRVVADSFRLAANQILSLKKSELFSDIKVVDSSRNLEGQAVFALDAYFAK